MTGLEYSYPRRLKNLRESGPRFYPTRLQHHLSPSNQTGKYDLVFKLQERIQNEPKIAEYLKSNRRQQFGAYGIFRSYPELDNEE
jgi:hypothetical protein